MIRYVVIVALLLLSVSSWWYAASLYRENKTDIILGLEYLAREIALPYHILEMTLRDPVEVLPMPVYGVLLDDVADTWGNARSEGRTHEGVDIFAERGTPIFSSTVGYVRRLNFGSRGGRNVMVIGPGGINYYYAHLERIAEGIERGVAVTPDTILGFVGNTGNATATSPHLHFGVYPARWDAVNPYPLLTDRWTE